MAINRADRAKQFIPFDALKGLQEALREKEKELENVERKELSEESLENLSRKLNRIEVGDNVEILYYNNKRYIRKKGCVQKIEISKHKLIFEDCRISFEDIIEIKN